MSQARVNRSRSWLVEQDFPPPAGCAQRHRQGVKNTFPVRRSLASWREKINLGRWATKSILNES
jgi:hypothetical protein